MIDIETLEKELLSLDLRQRGRLVSVLLKSLDNEESGGFSKPAIEKLWIEEAIRRNREMDEDPSVSIPYEVVMREARNLLK